MNNSQYVINNIKSSIPLEILQMCFLPTRELSLFPASLDSLIKQTIIINKVSVDCNMIAGEETNISLIGIPFEQVQGGLIVRIGFGPTNGRVISSALSVNYGNFANAYGGATIASALSAPQYISETRVQLVGENIIYIEGYVVLNFASLRCILMDDAEFNNLPVRLLQEIVTLCVLATKAYIYNTMTIKLGSGVIVQGVDYGRIKEIVDSYSDANADYHTELTTNWFAMRTMADHVAYTKLIRMQVPR